MDSKREMMVAARLLVVVWEGTILQNTAMNVHTKIQVIDTSHAIRLPSDLWFLKDFQQNVVL